MLGTCRSYALFACAILRQHDRPARLRVGFANYFTPEFAEDHWVCEYHDGDVWRLLDAELSAEVRRRYAVLFPPADVPQSCFLSAARAWTQLRCGEADPARFGVSALSLNGMWFVAGSMLRDLAALNMEEMMPWDYWGPARNFQPGAAISTDWLSRLDNLADALNRIGGTTQNARSILAENAWAALEASVLSFPQGQPIEVTIR